MARATLNLVKSGEADPVAAWLTQAAGQAQEAELRLLRGAAEFAREQLAGRALPGGEPALSHALGTAGILLELRLDADALAAGLLAPVVMLAPERLPALRERFGQRVGELLDGVLRMVHLGALSTRRQAASLKQEQQAAQLEALRKMLLAMVQDVRVVLVKLADHTQHLRWAARLEDSAERTESARLTHDIFAPLADRLGVWQIKWEMEDLAFRVLEPDTYRRIARMVDEKRADRERYVENVAAQLQGELTRCGIAAEVTGRPKHIYSIYRKMQRKGMDFEALHDVRAVRVLVGDVKDCYAALGVTHSLWAPMPKEFDDYIAKPKSNGYRSLHTAVIGPEGKAIEVQIRTHEMHQHAELGVAAHWRYKEGARRDESYDRKIAWLRQVLEWKDEAGNAGALAEQFRTRLFEDTIYVLTPQGKVIDLPRGATPVDFAYHVHTELGHRCRGARVDGAMVPLNTPLASGQQVEIIAAKQGGPSRDWLNPELGYVKSAAARSKIRQWFNRQNLEAAAAQGRALVEKALQREGMTGLGLERIAAQLGFARADDLLVEVARGEVRARQLQEALRALGARSVAPAAPAAPTQARTAPAAAARGGVLVVGVDRLLTVPARCCKPVPPEPIVGFVTRGRGVSVHRAGCANVRRLDRKRLVPAQWGEHAGAGFAVEVEIEAAERAGLARDISEVLAREKIRVIAARVAGDGARTRMRYTLEVADLSQLQRVLLQVRDVTGVAAAVRR